MKYYISIFFITLFLNLNGQDSRIETDAIWVYSYSSMNKLGKEVITNKNEDTIISNVSYKILDRKGLYYNDDRTDYDTLSLQSYFVRSDSCCIYQYSTSNEEESKLYDFDLIANDQVDFLDLRYYNDYSINVASSEQFLNNGDSIIRQFISVKLNNYPENMNVFPILNIENIGAQNANFNLTELGDPWGDVPYYRLCQYRSIIREYLNYETSACKELDDRLTLNSTIETQKEDYSIAVYPNPFQDQLSILDPNNRIDKIEIRNLLGQLIKRTNKCSTIKINNSSSNLLFLAFDNKGNIVKRELIFSPN